MSSDVSLADWETRSLSGRRGPHERSAWERGFSAAQDEQGSVNVGNGERIASLVAGAALALAGRNKGSLGGLILGLFGAGLVYRGAMGRCYCYRSLGISTAEHNPNTVVPAGHGVRVEESVTVNRPAAELYEFWRDIRNLPQVFKHLKSVTVEDGNCSRWTAAGPGGIDAEWEAEVINDDAGRLIAWRSLPGSQIDTAGSIRFDAVDDHRTQVTVNMKYNPPGGKLTDYVASWFGQDLEAKLAEDMRNFRTAMNVEAARPSVPTM